MGIKYDTREIDEKLKSLTTHDAKLQYLKDYLFGLNNQLAAFEAFELSNLLRLQEISKTDYQLYGTYLDNGGLIHFNSRFEEKTNQFIIHNSDKRFADKIGIKDITTLLRRLSVENSHNELKGRIILIRALLDKVSSNNPEISTSQQIETKTDKLKSELGKYGFFEISKVKHLTEPNKQYLVELISTNGLPYSIAMFDFLDFLKHIESEHFKTKYKLNREVAKWFDSDKEGRAVKGNISTLSDYSRENKSKYTAHTHKETVIKDYQKLK